MNNKIDRKYMPLIIFGLAFAFLIRSSYSIYCDFISINATRVSTYVLNVFYAILEYGVLYAFITYLIVSIIYSAGFRRYVRYISRNDFISIILIAIIIVQAVLGIINIFSILVPVIASYVSLVESTIMAIVFLLCFFLIICKKYDFNPVEKANSFRVWFSGLLVIQGIEVILLGGGILLLAKANPAILSQYGLDSLVTNTDEIFAIISISLYAAFAIVVIVLNYVLRSKAVDYQDPETRSEYNFIKEQEEKQEVEKEKHDDHHDDINDIFDI